MRILGVAGSNRKAGNSYLLLKEMFDGFSDIETRIIQVAELNIRPCELCFDLCAQKPFECAVEDDLRMLLDEMKSADGIVLACPKCCDVPSRFQPVLERIGCLDYITMEKHGKGLSPLKGKLCALIVVSAGGGFHMSLLRHLHESSLIVGMRPITPDFWPHIGFFARSGGVQKGAISEQTEVIEQARDLLRSLVSEIEKEGTG